VSNRRVVVTGIGLVSSLGIGTSDNWKALLAGRSGVETITKFDAKQFATQIAGEVRGFDPLQFIEKKDVKKMDVFIQYAIAASQFAMDDARLTIEPDIATRVGVFIASGIGGFTTIEREHKALLEGGPRKISPFFIPSAIINLAAGQVSIRYGAKGPNSATCTACSASAHAIGDAYEIIRRGAADIMIAGGSEAAITPMGIGGFGALRVMNAAIDSAGISKEQVQYINAHGTSTPQGDSLESLAIKRTFGDHAYKLAVSSTKSMTGHLLGAAGGLEAGITALAVHDQVAPPTINLDCADPLCDLDYVPKHSRRMPIEYALSNSFGFGGTNAALLFKRYEA
jgi:3-oxoacyl-(acyl-carrier-protein) synthase